VFVIEHRGCRLTGDIRGAGPPVLLIQGVGVHGGGWPPQVDVLSARYRCLTFDNRGMNRSQPIGAPLSVEQMAEDARILMDSQGWESAHLVGHSMGGLIALHLALSSRRRVSSLSLLCTFARGRDATRLSPWMIWVGLRARIGTRRQRRRAFLQLVMPPETLANSDLDALAERLAPIFGHDLAEQPPVAMKQLSAMCRYDASPNLGELAGLPTLVVIAAYDRIARPELGRALAAGVPGARYIEIADASHGVTIERPDLINNLLLEHFAQAQQKLKAP
jgi:pimeloyl-ACP methyl ester carboxylesterase